MTADDLKKRFQIPAEALEIYEKLGEGKGKGALDGETAKMAEYDDRDLERIGEMMTLREAGFCQQEILRFLRLEGEGWRTKGERLAMLEERRRCLLAEIHEKEREIRERESEIRERRSQIHEKETEIREKEKILGELDHLRYGSRESMALQP